MHKSIPLTDGNSDSNSGQRWPVVKTPPVCLFRRYVALPSRLVLLRAPAVSGNRVLPRWLVEALGLVITDHQPQ